MKKTIILEMNLTIYPKKKTMLSRLKSLLDVISRASNVKNTQNRSMNLHSINKLIGYMVIKMQRQTKRNRLWGQLYVNNVPDSFWIVIETGDGQVSGLSQNQFIFKYYDDMREMFDIE